MLCNWFKIMFYVTIIHFLQEVNSQCQQIESGVCISCPIGMHLYRDNCIFDLPGCLQYEGGFDCSKCRQQYLLSAGQCFHPKISPDLYDKAQFSTYLQSSLKPDSNLATAQQTIETNLQPWMEWLNYTIMSYNGTLFSKDQLRTSASQLRNKIMGLNSTPILEYIHSASNKVDTISYLFYRLTYKLVSSYGYADLLVSMELLNHTLNYIELSSLNIQELPSSNWTELAYNDVCLLYVQNVLLGIFQEIANQTLVKGFSQAAPNSTAFNLFYMSNSKGIIDYLYEATYQQLPKTANSSSVSSTNSSNNSESNPNSSCNQSKSTCDSSNSWTVAKVSDLSNNLVFMTGFAVAVQQLHVPATCSVTAIFYKYSPLTYAMYFSDASNSTNLTKKYYKFVFRINETLNQFQVVNFQTSDQPIPPFPCTKNNSETNTGYLINTTINENSNMTNETQSISNTTTKDKNQSLNSNSSVPTTTVDNIAKNCPKLSNTVDIDITAYQNTDIFLPKINLLLRKMYASFLANYNLSAASYSWTLDDNSMISNIAYTLIYKDLNSITLAFNINISHNQIQFVSLPANITQDATTLNNASNTNGTTNQTSVKNSSSANFSAGTKNDTASIDKNDTTNKSLTSPTSYTAVALSSVTNEPKYQSLVMILRYLYQLPDTTTVQEIQERQDNSSNWYYLVVFHTQTADKSTDSTTIRINQYQLKVNTSGFVSILSSNVQYIQNTTETTVVVNTDTINTSSNLLKTKPRQLSLIQTPSLHLPQIISLFELHSPQLKFYQASSFQCQLIEYQIENSINIFKEAVSFKGATELCFQVYYGVSTDTSSFINSQRVQVISYNIISCNDDQNQVDGHLTADFTQTSSLNPKINGRILSIIGQQRLLIESYKQYLDFYQVRLTTTSGNQQIIIDAHQMVILAFRKDIVQDDTSLNISKLLNIYARNYYGNQQ